MAEYVLDNAWHEARERLALLERGLDPGTVRHLDTIGIAPAWRCLEVGGGGGSITEWLCQRVCPAGHVLATDLDTRFLSAIQSPNLEVRTHNILTDALPAATFDLVHLRYVLAHLPERQLALQRLVASLKPGGWLLAEEPDYASNMPDPTTDPATATLFCRGRDAVVKGCADHGLDLNYGRSLPSDFQRLGLDAAAAEGRMHWWPGGAAGARFIQLTYAQIRGIAAPAGPLTDDEYTGFLDLWSDQRFNAWSHLTVAAWGRRPAA